MKIDSKKFARLFEKSTISRTIVPNCLIEPVKTEEEEGLKIVSKSTDNILAVYALIKMKSVDIPKLSIKDTGFFLDCLKLFNGEVYLKVEGNMLKIYNDSKDIDIPLASEDFIDTKLESFPEIPGLNESFTIKTNFLNNVVKNVQLLKANDISFKVSNNVLTVEAGEKGFDKITEKESVHYKDFKSKFGPAIVDIVSILDDKVSISVSDNSPIQFEEQIDDLNLKILLAPKKGDDNSSEKNNSTKEEEVKKEEGD